jgi:hypothetical protein
MTYCEQWSTIVVIASRPWQKTIRKIVITIITSLCHNQPSIGWQGGQSGNHICNINKISHIISP